MLGRQCQIYDIEDIEAFVIMCIKRSGCKPRPYEWDDMIATGLMLLWEMSNNYKPPPVEGNWSFSGYAVRYMPKKIKEAHHRNLEYALKTLDDDGRRTWTYRQNPVSLNVVLEEIDDDGSRIYTQEKHLRLPGNFVEVPQQET